MSVEVVIPELRAEIVALFRCEGNQERPRRFSRPIRRSRSTRRRFKSAGLIGVDLALGLKPNGGSLLDAGAVCGPRWQSAFL